MGIRGERMDGRVKTDREAEEKKRQKQRRGKPLATGQEVHVDGYTEVSDVIPE